MKEISPSDLLEVRPQSLFSTEDYKYLLDLYAPILGIKAIGVYFALSNIEPGEVISHQSLFTRNQLSAGEFIAALSGLEAMGLLQTYKKSEAEYQLYCYCTYSPRTPREFLGNELLAGTLAKYVGETALEALANKYQTEDVPQEYENVSQTFQGFFSPDFSDPIYGESAKDTGGRKLGSINTGFDRNAFLIALREMDPRFNFDSFSKIEFVKIARITALYNYEEDAMAAFVRESFLFKKPIGERLNVKHLAKLAEENFKYSYLHKVPSKSNGVHGDSGWAKLFRKMETTSPIDFLSHLQKGNKPAKPDLDLIHTLTVDMGLSNPVCNALICYITSTHNNTLPTSLTQKVAGSLVREGIETAIDAINYMESSKFSKTSKKVNVKNDKQNDEIVQVENISKDIEKDGDIHIMSEQEMEDFLNNIDIGD